MDPFNILDLLRLKSAPWFLLVMSVVALFTVWGVFHGIAPSTAVGEFLLALGLPSGAAAGARAVHEWIVTEPRATWASWGVLVLMLGVGIRYVAAVYYQREARNESQSAGRVVSSANSRAFDDGVFREPDEQRLQRVRMAEKAHREKAKYARQVQRYEGSLQLQCAASYWLIAAVTVELLPTSLRPLDVSGASISLVTFLLVIGGLTLVALLIACAMEEFYDSYERPTGADRFKDTAENFGWELILLAFRLALVLGGLPLFVLGYFLYPRKAVSAAADG